MNIAAVLDLRSGLLCIAVAALLSGCAPSATGLYGIWGNLDEGTWRVFEFASELDDATVQSVEPDFFLYLYADGEQATVVQRGWYEVYSPENDNIPCDELLDLGCDDDRSYLVTHVLWSEPAGLEGDYSNEILSFASRSMTLESSSAVDGRVFEKTTVLP